MLLEHFLRGLHQLILKCVSMLLVSQMVDCGIDVVIGGETATSGVSTASSINFSNSNTSLISCNICTNSQALSLSQVQV